MNSIEESLREEPKKLKFVEDDVLDNADAQEMIEEASTYDDNVNFREFFFETVEKAFIDEYTRCLNYEDTLTVLCDAYILMFEDVDKLHRSPSVQWWIRKNRNVAYSSCVRRKSLINIYEVEEGEEFPTINREDIFELWKRIKKIGNVNAFILMPKPFGSVNFSKAVKNAIRSISPQRAMTIATTAGIVVVSIIIGAVLYTQIVPMLTKEQDGTFAAEEEIFLDESFYEQYNITTVDVEIDYEIMDAVMKDAAERADEKIAEDERIKAQEEAEKAASQVSSVFVIDKEYEFLSRDPKDEVKRTTTTTVIFIPHEVEGSGSLNSAANKPEYTGDTWLDKELKNVVSLLLKDSMNDSQKLSALYEYVCKYGKYAKAPQGFESYVDSAKHFFKYREGTSAEYASAFYALCEAAGYRCDLIKGYFYTVQSDGKKKYYDHVWCMITLNGIEYHFDPEADSNNNGSAVNKNYFMVAKDNSRWKLFIDTHAWS